MEQKPLIPAHFLYLNEPGFEDPFNYGLQTITFESDTPRDMVKSLEKRKEWQEKIWTLFHDLYISELRKRRENKEISTDCLLSVGQVVLYKPQGIFREATPQGKL